MLVTLTHPIAGFTGVVTVLEKYALPFNSGTASIDLDPAAFNAVANAGITLTIGAQAPAPPYDSNFDTIVAPIVTSAASDTSAALRAALVSPLPTVGSLTYNGDGTIAADPDGNAYTWNTDGTPATQTKGAVTRTFHWNTDGSLASVS